MKRVFITVLAVAAAMTAFGQKSNVTKAGNALYEEPVNFAKANQFINEAKVNPETSEAAHTWYVAGRIGYVQVNKEWQKILFQQQPDLNVLYTGLAQVFDNYEQAQKLDGKELDKKGNPKYTERKNIKSDYKEMFEKFGMVGVSLYNEKEYAKSYEMLRDYLAIADNPLFTGKEALKVDSTYNEFQYYALYAASNGELHAETMALAQVVAANEGSPFQVNGFELWAAELLAQGDTAAYVAKLKDAVAKFPTNQYVAGTLVNYYVGINQFDQAIVYLDNLIADNPDNAEYPRVKASLFIQTGDYEMAKKLLNECIAKDPNDASNQFYMGFALAEEGEKLQLKAEELPYADKKGYAALMAQSKAKFEEAIGYFEKAHDTMPADSPLRMDMLQNLRASYARAGRAADAQRIKEEMGQ